MLPFNLFSLHDLLGFMATASLAFLFYVVFAFFGRRMRDLYFANLLSCCAAVCFFMFLADNVVAQGTASRAVANAASLTLLWVRFMYVGALTSLACNLRLVFAYRPTPLRRRFYILMYLLAFAGTPIIWSTQFLKARAEPAAATSSWICCNPWWPDAGFLFLVFLAGWIVVNIIVIASIWKYSLMIKQVAERPPIRLGLVRFSMMLLAGGGIFDMFSGALGWSGIAIFPLACLGADGLAATALIRETLDGTRLAKEVEKVRGLNASARLARTREPDENPVMSTPSEVTPVGEDSKISDERFPSESETATLTVGQNVVPRIAGYSISSRLGEGGMGVVWRAVQLSTRREVALKLMNPISFGSTKARQWFEREIELAARLEHPNIARVYDSGLRQGSYFYAMELVEGVPLDEFVHQTINSRLLPEEDSISRAHRQILFLMRTVCAAMQYAHERGVIHRDLKPSNILVSPSGKPTILDFGLAKDLMYSRTDHTVTREGTAAGTPAYMSPEQAAGRSNEIGKRSDVYSLGKILFILLTGLPAHDLSGPLWMVLQRIEREEVRRPRYISKTIDQDLEALLLKALAHDAGHRYADAGELGAELDRYLDDKPVLAKPPTKTEMLRRTVRRHSLILGAFTAGIVTLVLFIAFAVLALKVSGRGIMLLK